MQSRDYDSRGHLADTEVTGLTVPLASFAYGFDAVGQLTTTETTLDGQDVDRAFEYDPLSQLANVATTTGSTTTDEDYDASPAGLLTEIVGGRELTYNAAQQLISADAIVGPDIEFGYDTAGRRTSTGPVAGAATTYGYDAAGYLASVTTPTETVGYTTDARGLRQTRTDETATDDWLWSTVGGLPLLLDDGDHSYIYGPSSTPIAQIDDTGTVEYLHTDLLGSVRLITDEDGDAIATSTFDEFGTRVNHTGASDSAFGFTGAWTDPDTGLVHLRARDYDPATGQFLTVDPAVDQTRQPYAYTGNNPLTRIDPTGLAQCDPANAACISTALGTTSSKPLDDLLYDFWSSDSGTNVSSLFAGITDTLTISLWALPFGETSLTGLLRNKLAPGWTCVYEQNGFFTFGSIWAGALGGGGGAGSSAGQTALRAGDTAVKTTVDEVFHYTSSQAAQSIAREGLNAGSFATPQGGLKPLQAVIELALPPNRAAPTTALRIDLAGLREAGFDIPAITRVTNQVSDGVRRYLMPGGGTEMLFPYPIPAEFLSIVL